MLVPIEAIAIFKEYQDEGPEKVVERRVLTLRYNRPVSLRRAQEWYKEYKANNYIVVDSSDWEDMETSDPVLPEDVTPEELNLLKQMFREEAGDDFVPMSYDPDQFENTKISYNEYDPEDRIAKLRQAMQIIKDIQNEDDPIFTSFVKDFKSDRPVAVMWPSCMHMGGRYTDDAFIEQQLSEFADYGYFFDLGDEIDGFTPAWFHAGSIVEQPLQVPYQIALFDAYMERFWHKIIGGMWSQHGSMWFEKNQGYTPLKRRFLERGLPFFDGRANLTFKVGSQVYNIAASHEFSGTSQWNQTHSLIKALRMDYPNADVIVQGDKHTFKMDEMLAYQEEFEAGRRQTPFVHLIQTGTAKSGPDKYTIKRWNKGAAIWPITVFFPDQHLVKTTRHMEDAIKWVTEY
jgi:hypothetical protein